MGFGLQYSIQTLVRLSQGQYKGSAFSLAGGVLGLDSDRGPVSLCQGMVKVEKRIGEKGGFGEKLMGLEKNLVEGPKIKITK